MISRFTRIFFFLLLPATASDVFALNRYALIEAFLPHDQHPRILNSEDIATLRSVDPQPLFSPEGDFNQDGIPDVAIAGVFQLPEGKNRFFLLVGSEFNSPIRYEKYFLQTYDQPVFIHNPGTTGEGDPGNQAFSISFCYDCDQGIDFYWNRKKTGFDVLPWKANIKRFHKSVEREADQASPETVEKALKIVGGLADVNDYIKALKQRNGSLAVRVVPDQDSGKSNRATVRIIEKKEGGDFLFDEIQVDLRKNRVIKRRKK